MLLLMGLLSPPSLGHDWFANWYGPVVKKGFTQPGA